jgi:hypothetical protein
MHGCHCSSSAWASQNHLLRAAYGRRVGAARIARRDALTQPLQVRALIFLFFHPHDTPRVAILLALVCLPEK